MGRTSTKQAAGRCDQIDPAAGGLFFGHKADGHVKNSGEKPVPVAALSPGSSYKVKGKRFHAPCAFGKSGQLGRFGRMHSYRRGFAAERSRFRGQSYQMTAPRGFRAGRGILAPASEQCARCTQHPLVAASMPFGTLAGLGALHSILRLAERTRAQAVVGQAALDLAQGVKPHDGAMVVLYKGRHGKGHGGAAFKLHAADLMIRCIVVAGIYASAVRSGMQSVVDFFFAGLAVAQYDDWLPTDAGAEAVQRSIRENDFAGRARQPMQKIHVVADFGHDHGTGLVAVPSAAAHKTVGLMPVSHMFRRVDGFPPSHEPIGRQLMRLKVKSGIAQHMAGRPAPSALAGLFPQGETFIPIWKDVFSQQQIGTFFQSCQGLGDVADGGSCRPPLRRRSAAAMVFISSGCCME